MPPCLVARFELLTPAFAGGAFADGPAALRVEAIIGQLRRWWWARAPLRAEFRGRNGSFDRGAAERRAGVLFGASGDDKGTLGQGAFLITLIDNTCVPCRCNCVLKPPEHFRDLFGPLWGKRQSVLWTDSDAAPRFTVRFRCRPKLPEGAGESAKLADELCAALKLWGLLGGLGAGSRRGFGSVRLLEIARDEVPAYVPPADLPEYKAAIADALGAEPASGAFPAIANAQTFAAFANDASLQAAIRYSFAPNASLGIDVLDWLGKELRNQVPGEKYPINFMSEQIGNERQPSPYHLHIGKIGEQFVCFATTLAYDWGAVRADRAKTRAQKRQAPSEARAAIDRIVGRIEDTGGLFEVLKMKRLLP